jgi:preprotein translocase subunit SecB
MSTTNEQESIIEVQTIVLENINFARGFAVENREDIQASLGMHLEQPKEGQVFRSTRCNVELKDADENQIVLVQTIFRTEFDIQGNASAPGIDAYLSSLAMRVTYPYHRQLISTLTAQSGLPGMTIPLISEDQLDVISKESRGSREAAPSNG